jgi:hypothetical protein
VKRPGVWLLVLLLAASAREASADRETAEFFAQRAQKAASAGDAAAAEGHWRRSLQEDATYLPARFGLADALAAQNKRAEAATEIRAGLVEVDRAKSLPAAWRELAEKARKRLGELGGPGGTLESLTRRYVDGLLALSDRWQSRDAAFAERVLRLAFEADPDHPGVRPRFATLGLPIVTEVLSLFDGKEFDGEVPTPDDESWKIEGGLLVGGLPGKCHLIKTTRVFDGDYDVRMEARIARRHGTVPKLGLAAGHTPNRAVFVFGVIQEEVLFDFENGTGGRERLFTVLLRNAKPTFDPAAWTAYEMRLRGEEVSLLVNGNLLRKQPRPKLLRAGLAGVMVQDARVEVRRFEVVRH